MAHGRSRSYQRHQGLISPGKGVANSLASHRSFKCLKKAGMHCLYPHIALALQHRPEVVGRLETYSELQQPTRHGSQLVGLKEQVLQIAQLADACWQACQSVAIHHQLLKAACTTCALVRAVGSGCLNKHDRCAVHPACADLMVQKRVL